MKLRLIILTAILTFVSCTSKNEMQAELLMDDIISIKWKGSTIIEYKKDSFQLGYNDKANEYRVFKDDLSSWFTVKCSEKPVAEGQTLTADIQWKSGSQALKSYSKINMVVKKADDSGLLWLWNNTDSIGIIIQNQ